MRKVREILSLRLGVGLSASNVARSCKVGKTTVLEYEKRFQEAGYLWPPPDDIDDSMLERIVRARLDAPVPRRGLPDMGYLLEEMKRPHVTLSLLWLEYRERLPEGYGYTQFCHYYNQAKARVDVVLRQEHRAGEKLFTDYAGDTLTLVDPATGEISPVYVFALCWSPATRPLLRVSGARGSPVGWARTSGHSSSSAECPRSLSRTTPGAR